MFKLFRAVKSEHRKLWCKRSPLMWIVIAAAAAVCIFCACDNALEAGAGEWLIHNPFYDAITDDSFERTRLELEEETPQTVPDSRPTVSMSDTTSGSDTVSETDAGVSSAPTPTQEITDEAVMLRIAARESERWHDLQNEIELCTEKDVLNRMKYEQAMAGRKCLIATYRAANGLFPDKSDRMWLLLQMTVWLFTPFAAVVISCAASDMFAGEFSRRTVYMNLARPITRIKQYIAKLLTAAGYSAMLMLSAFFGALLAGMLRVGVGSGRFVGCINDKVYESGWLRQSIMVLLCCFASVMMSVAVCAVVGNLSRSRAAAVAASAVVTFGGFFLGRIIAPMAGIVTGASLPACIDLTAPLAGCANYPSLSFADCIISFGVHFITAVICGYALAKRDISE